LYREVINVIVSAKRTGGGVVQALASISDDMRQNLRLYKERRAKTMVQVLFIIIAADFVAPFIFGLVAGIILFLGSISGDEIPALFETLLFYFKGYLVVSAVFFRASGFHDSGRQHHKNSYFMPLSLLVVSYTIFVIVHYFANIFFVV